MICTEGFTIAFADFSYGDHEKQCRCDVVSESGNRITKRHKVGEIHDFLHSLFLSSNKLLLDGDNAIT